MARPLKTYVASVGFYDLAVAAPSMKAAAQAWGSGGKLFTLGLARQTEDPAIVAAAMARPGVVLRRPVGSTAAFTEHAALPKALPAAPGPKRPGRTRPHAPAPSPSRSPPPAPQRPARATAAAAARESARRQRAQRKLEAARERNRRRRAQDVARAEAALARAEARHAATMRALSDRREALERQARDASAQWNRRREMLEAALDRARSSARAAPRESR